MSERKRYNAEKEVPGYDENQNYSRAKGAYYRNNISPSLSPAPHHATTKKHDTNPGRRSRSRSYEKETKNERGYRSNRHNDNGRDSNRNNKFSDRPRETIRPPKKTGFHDTLYEDDPNQNENESEQDSYVDKKRQ